jgi:DNA polymerase-3 subunit gamma/tau
MALYRRYRPMVFGDVIGQESIVDTLKNQIRQGSIAHAYLFAGIRGTGKTSTAKILARAINCLEPIGSEPCNKCEICKGILGESIMDVVEIDAASNNSVDDVRELRENARYAPAKAKNKVYIIDEVHMLSKGAFNALLKILEEPPVHTVFILATTEPEKIPETIRSRCQRFDFRRVGQSDLMGRLKYILSDLKIDAEEEALRLIAHNADGGVRDALSLLDQCLAFSEGVVTKDVVQSVLGISADGFLFEFMECVIDRDADGTFEKLEEIFSAGKETNQFLKDLTQYMRALMIAGLKESAEKILGVGPEQLERLKKQRKRAGMTFILRGLDLLSDYEYRIKYAPQPRILLEMLILRLLRPEYDNSLEAVLQRLDKAESELAKIKKHGLASPVAKREMQELPKSKEPEIVPRKRPEAMVEKPTNKTIETDISREIPNDPISKETNIFSELMDKWNDVLNEIRMKNRSTHAFLREAIPKDIKNGNLILFFKKDYSVHMKKVSGLESKKIIEDAILEETGFDVNIECIMEGSRGEAVESGEEEARIKEVFKGFEKLIEIED